MRIDPGTRVGPYDVLAPLGAGGMGVVYRARDTRLGRDVAVKFLPAEFAADPERVRRFEQEARATGALNHPNVLAVYDVGAHGGESFLVTELLEGETLRERLSGGALPVRKAVDLATQIARGLAAAHEKGIVHRDLKPENLFVTKDGHVKVLDFGLAKVASGATGAEKTVTTPPAELTGDGVVLGTAGYMAPEQVRGLPADARSDIFALGCIVYEMLSGRRAFRGETSAETMTAILREEPDDLAASGRAIPPALDRVVRRCLEKVPAERFQSAHDLAFALTASSETSGVGVVTGAPAGRPARRIAVGVAAPVAALVLVLATGAAFLVGRGARAGRGAAGEPVFTRLTFGRGAVRSARFTPDGKTVVYGAAWDGQPIRIFLTQLGSQESTAVSLPDADVLAVSRNGELAISLGHTYLGWMGAGTLARAPMLGGGARALLENVREADWNPDGSDLAVVRRLAGRERLEYPIGRVLHATTGYISHIRFSPRGDRIAFADHPLYADDLGSVATVDLAGTVTKLAGPFSTLRGIAWSPDGDEVYFTALRSGRTQSLYAVDLHGRQRYVLGGASNTLLLDISKEGRMLLGNETHVRNLEALTAGASAPRDVSLMRAESVGRFITPDGTMIPITDQNGEMYATYLRRADGSPPVRLGQGDAYDISADGRWVLSLTPEEPPRILLHPTGTGQTREVPNPARILVEAARFMPDGRRLVVLGQGAGGTRRGFLLAIDSGQATPFTGEGVTITLLDSIPMTRDGTRVLAQDISGAVAIYRTDGGAPEPVRGLSDGDYPIEFCDDGRSVFVGHLDGVLWHVFKLDLATGGRTPWTGIRPAEVAGLRLSWPYITPNGRYWVHAYSRLLTDVYAAEGVR